MNALKSRARVAGLPHCLAVMLLMLLAENALAAEVDLQSCRDNLSGRRVTLIVPYGPGGGWDSYGRLFAAAFEPVSGTRVFVRNIAGAGGLLGIRAVAQARPSSLTLGIFNPAALLSAPQSGVNAPDADAFHVLGSLITDTVAMVAAAERRILAKGQPPLVIGAIDTELAMTFLALRALALEASPILGYSGSAERFLALLRGEIDVIVGTSESLARAVQSTPGTQAVLSFTAAPTPVFPDTPFLAGNGGVVDQLTRDLPGQIRQRRMHMADLAAQISRKPRTVNVSKNVPAPLAACLSAAVEQTLFSEEIRDLARNRNLELAPDTAVDAQALINSIRERLRQNEEIIDQVLSEVQDSR